MESRSADTRCVIYCRISKDLAGDEHGITNQLEECRRYANTHGWDIIAEYADNDISATYGKPRPGYRDMMCAVAARKVDCIVIFHTSRLWRNRKERAEGIEILRKAAISVQAAKGPSLDMSTAYGRGMADLIGSFDSIEVEIKSERQELAARQRAEAGKPPLGVRLTGYTTAGDIIESEAQTVRRIYARFHAGDSLKGVARWLNDMGVSTRHGKPWNPSSVRDILTNPRYAGRVYYNRHEDGTSGDWVPAVFPAIIEEHTFDAVNAKLADPRRRRQSGTDRKHLGASVYQCGICRRPVRSHYLGGRPGYRCPNGHVNRTAAPIDKAVTALIRARLCWPDVASLVNAPTDKKASAAAEKLQKQRGRLIQVEQDYDNDLIDGKRYKEKKGKIEAEIQAARAQLTRLMAGTEVAETLTAANPVAAFDSAPLGIQQAVIRFFMEVELLPAPRGRKGFDPETIRITPKHPVRPELHAASSENLMAS
jgi:site-specific DNA recombinase